MKYKLFILTCCILSLNSVSAFAGIGTTGTNIKNINSNIGQTRSGIGTNNTINYKGESSSKSDYTPTIPNNNFMSDNDVNNVKTLSPVSLNRGFTVSEHIGHKDTAYKGARHIATYNNGIQWFGYDKDNFSDIILTNKDINGKGLDISLQQAPVRADWHTIDGSGIVFNATTNAPPNIEITNDSNYTFEGCALVATTQAIELRYYGKTTLKDFCSGNSEYDIIFTTPKTCNSQDFRVIYNGVTAEIYLDNKLLTKQNIAYIGNYVGAMVDYMEHNCTSLSSVYMYNMIVNGKNYFEKEKERE